jgi:hypothetical protein
VAQGGVAEAARKPPRRVLGGFLLLFYPCFDVAFTESEGASYAVGGEAPFFPFGSDGAFGDAE